MVRGDIEVLLHRPTPTNPQREFRQVRYVYSMYREEMIVVDVCDIKKTTPLIILFLALSALFLVVIFFIFLRLIFQRIKDLY